MCNITPDAAEIEQQQSKVWNPTPDDAQNEQTQAEKTNQTVDKVVEKKKKIVNAVEKKKQVAKEVEKKKQVAKAVEKNEKLDVKNTYASKRSNDRLKSIWRSKNNVGPGSTSVAPLVVNEKPYVKKMRSWEEIWRRMTQ